MGCIFSNQRALSTAVQREIHASCDTVWEVVADIEAIPSTVPNVESIEFVDSVQDFAVGTKWRETRRVGKDVVPQVKTIARIEQGDYPRSITLNISFPKPGEGNQYQEGAKTEDIENVCTFTVQPVSETLCVIICSIAFASRDGTERCCSCLLMRYAEKYLLEELDGYAEVAIKRQQAKDQRPKDENPSNQ